MRNYARGRFDEVVWTFLKCDATKEENYMPRPVLAAAVILHDFFRIDAVVDDTDPIEGNAVPAVNERCCVVADSHHHVSSVHAEMLNLVNLLIDVLATAVVLETMHMRDERFAGEFLKRYARRKGHPVMTMDDVEI